MAKKDLIHTAGKCGGHLLVEYTDSNIPFLVCELCNHKIDDWIKWFEQYSNYWQDPIKWQSKKDHLMCLLGYFSYLYKNFYQLDFTFSLNERGLFRGPELVQMRKLYKMLDENVDICKKYLDWMFEIKLKNNRKKITTLGFLATASIVNEFKFFVQKNKYIDRNTPLPGVLIKWIEANIPEVYNDFALNYYGDLNLLLTHYKNGNISKSQTLDGFVSKLINSKCIDSDLKITNWRNDDS